MEPSAAPLLQKRVASDGETAKQLLRAMHKVFSHDLPNQILVMQTLLQMLEIEESDKLSDDGREQLQRLQSTMLKASRMVRFLKEMARLQGCVPQRSAIPLDRIIQDVRGELYQRFPDKDIELDWHISDASVVADQRYLTLAIVEYLGTNFMDPDDPPCATWEGMAEWRKGEVELRFWSSTANGAVPPAMGPQSSTKTIDLHMELMLAGEWLKLAGGSLVASAKVPLRSQLTIVLRGETAHG